MKSPAEVVKPYLLQSSTLKNNKERSEPRIFFPLTRMESKKFFCSQTYSWPSATFRLRNLLFFFLYNSLLNYLTALCLLGYFGRVLFLARMNGPNLVAA